MVQRRFPLAVLAAACASAALAAAALTAPAAAAEPPGAAADEIDAAVPPHVARARVILRQLIEDARDACTLLGTRSVERILEDLDPVLDGIPDEPEFTEDEEALRRGVAHLWERYVWSETHPAGAALSPSVDPLVAIPGPAGTDLSGAGSTAAIAPVLETTMTTVPISGSGLSEDAAPRERVVALARSLAELPEADRGLLEPVLKAVIAAEILRHDNWGSWDSYRVEQWRSVFDQSRSFSWWVFIVAHLVLAGALVMSFWEFARAGMIAREKRRDQTERRADRQAMATKLAGFAPEAQVAGITGLLAKVEEQTRQDTELEISANKLVMRTSIMGFVMMAFALAFYALFILYVYPVHQVQSGAATPAAEHAAAASR